MSYLDLSIELQERILRFSQERKERIIKSIKGVGDEIYQLIGSGTKESIKEHDKEIIFRKKIILENIEIKNKEGVKDEFVNKIIDNFYDTSFFLKLSNLFNFKDIELGDIYLMLRYFIIFFLIEPLGNSFDVKSENSEIKIVFDKEKNDLIISIIDDGSSDVKQRENDGFSVGGKGVFIDLIKDELNGKILKNIDEGAIFLYRINIEKIKNFLLKYTKLME